MSRGINLQLGLGALNRYRCADVADFELHTGVSHLASLDNQVFDQGSRKTLLLHLNVVAAWRQRPSLEKTLAVCHDINDARGGFLSNRHFGTRYNSTLFVSDFSGNCSGWLLGTRHETAEQNKKRCNN